MRNLVSDPSKHLPAPEPTSSQEGLTCNTVAENSNIAISRAIDDIRKLKDGLGSARMQARVVTVQDLHGVNSDTFIHQN